MRVYIWDLSWGGGVWIKPCAGFFWDSMRANCLAELLELGLKLNHKKKLDEKFCLEAKLEVINVGIPIFQLIPYVNYIGESQWNPRKIMVFEGGPMLESSNFASRQNFSSRFFLWFNLSPISKSSAKQFARKLSQKNPAHGFVLRPPPQGKSQISTLTWGWYFEILSEGGVYAF